MRAEHCELCQADLTLYRDFLEPVEATSLFAELQGPGSIAWRQEQIRLYGRTVAVPRLTAWYGEPGAAYSYSGLAMQPEPWSRVLLELRNRVADLAGAHFNSVLLNLYRDGADSVSWHSDDEPELGRDPVIASVSLGATRRFELRHRARRAREIPVARLALTAGSLLVMGGETQHHWQHRIPKTRKPCGPRINLTFREVKLPTARGEPLSLPASA